MKPVEEGSPVIGSIDMLRPVNGDRFLVSFSQLCRGLGRHVECLLWDAVAVSFLALARCWATEVQTRSDRWRLGHRRWSARWAWVVTRVLPCDGRAVRGAVDGFAAPVSWTVTLEIPGWAVVVADI